MSSLSPAAANTLPEKIITPALDFTSAACFWKGRVALYAILKALGIGPGDAVIVPGYTCVVVPAAVYFAGAKPLYADIDPATYNITLANIEQASQQEPVRAVVVQHTYGLPADIGPIRRWAAERGIAVIEDCCHALGSQYRDTTDPANSQWQPVGTWGDAAFFSSQWSKPVATGLGGWAIAADPALRARLHTFARQECQSPGWFESTQLAAQVLLHKLLFRPALYWQAQGMLRWLSKRGLMVGSSGEQELQMQLPADYAKRMTSWQRRLMLHGTSRLNEYRAQRRELQSLYEKELEAAGLPQFAIPEYADPALLRYPVRVSNKLALLARAREQHIELGDWFDHPLHPQGLNLEPLGWRKGLCPHGEQAAEQVVNLPLHRRVKREDVKRVVRLLAENAAR